MYFWVLQPISPFFPCTAPYFSHLGWDLVTQNSSNWSVILSLTPVKLSCLLNKALVTEKMLNVCFSTFEERWINKTNTLVISETKLSKHMFWGKIPIRILCARFFTSNWSGKYANDWPSDVIQITVLLNCLLCLRSVDIKNPWFSYVRKKHTMKIFYM